MSQIAEFERIEAIVIRPEAFRVLKLDEIQALRDSLLANVPPSTNSAFHERVRRAQNAIDSRLSEVRSDKHWWERPLGIVVLGSAASILAVAILYLVGA